MKSSTSRGGVTIYSNVNLDMRNRGLVLYHMKSCQRAQCQVENDDKVRLTSQRAGALILPKVNVAVGHRRRA